MDNIVYLDSTNELWVINDLEGVPAGKTVLKNHGEDSEGYTLISLIIPGMDAPIKSARVTEIYSDSGKTTQYASLAAFKSTCKAMLQTPEGGGSTSSTGYKGTIELYRTAQQDSIVAGTVVTFNAANEIGDVSGVSYNATAGTITVQAGYVVKMVGNVVNAYKSNLDVKTAFGWYNSSDAEVIGTPQILISATTAGYDDFGSGSARAVFDNSEGTESKTFRLKCLYANVTAIIGYPVYSLDDNAEFPKAFIDIFTV